MTQPLQVPNVVFHDFSIPYQKQISRFGTLSSSVNDHQKLTSAKIQKSIDWWNEKKDIPGYLGETFPVIKVNPITPDQEEHARIAFLIKNLRIEQDKLIADIVLFNNDSARRLRDKYEQKSPLQYNIRIHYEGDMDRYNISQFLVNRI